ncbi:uncharacterized protein LOC107365251 [Tetranychus urticae]|uniref:uncharacterized protein LOC107365251 n=1 Tax=Tetranychus urticae TaxID=32264 RepID=UPI00077C0179|nr:uncharacterized protein LOC107365251 [Tetranychus urticae]
MITSNNSDGSHGASENCFESCNIDAGWSDKTGLKSKKFSQTELEAFRKPFKLGWKREIVLRSTHTNSGKRIVDIYYFSPEKNVKLRSYVEIGLYLNRHPECDLEPENFTFARQPIFRAPFEIVRQANPRTRNENSEVTTPNHHQRSRTRSERMDKSERTDKLEKIEKSTEKSEKDPSKDPDDDNDIIVDSFNESIPDEILQNIPSMIPAMEGEDDYLGIVSHEEITRGTHEIPRKRLRTVETASPHRSDQTNNVDSNNHKESVKTTGVNGDLSNDIYNHSSSTTQPNDDNGFDSPTNSKKKTKSKYERPSKPDSTPKAVKLDFNESDTGKIMNGVSSEGINHNDFDTPRSRVEPDGKYSQSKKKNKSKSSVKLDKLKSDKKVILTKSLPKKETDITENYENYADDFLHCSFSVTPLASPDNTRYVAPSKIYRTESCENRTTTNSLKSRSKQSDKHAKIEKRAKKDKNDSEKDIVDCIIDSIPEEILNNLPPMLHPTPCSIMCFGKKGIIPTLLCDRCLCLYHPECVPAGIFLDNSHSFICPNCIHPNDAGETVGFLNGRLGDTEALAIGYHDQSVLFKRRRKASIENRILGNPIAPIAPIIYTASQIAEFLNTRINKCRKNLSRIKPEFNLLSSGYECLNQIFQHLSTRDLIKVKLTSRTFNRLASQPMLWQEITMKDMVIKDWQYFGRNIVEPMATLSINFDGIKCPVGSDLSEMWSNFATITDYLKSIKHIQFGTVPTSVIEEIINAAVTENCYNSFSNLETLSVRHLFEDDSAFQSCNLSILENIAYLSSLQHLRVDCKYGLIVNPEDSDLLDRIFAPMTNLKSLSMTTLKGFTVDQFSFLSHLQTLSSLEIGSCLNWANHDVKSYSSLSSSPPSPPSPSYSQEKLDHYETIEQFEDEAIVTDANLNCIVSETLNDVSADVEVEIEGEVDCEIELESAENETKEINNQNNQNKLKGVYRHLSKLTSLKHLKLVDLTINDTCNSMPLSLQGMTKLRSLHLENLIVLPDASQTLILLATTVNSFLKNLKELIISSNDPYTNKCVLSALKKIDKLESITWKVQVNVEDNGQCWVPILKENGEESELEEDNFDLAGEEDRLEMMDLDQLSQIIERHTLGATVNIIPQ